MIDKQLDQLKKTNEELKKENEKLTKNYFTVIQQRNKAERTIAEIKEIAENNFYYLECDYRWILDNILQKISEVKND